MPMSWSGKIVFFAAMAVLPAGCSCDQQQAGDLSGGDRTPPRDAPPDLAARPPDQSPPTPDAATGPCAAFAEGVVAGKVDAADLDEASGLAVSPSGVVWSHNDSGDTARLFALDSTGRHLATYLLTGVKATDWEDLAVGPLGGGGGQVLYVGDIGDNYRHRPEIVVYRVVEPKVAPATPPATLPLTGADALRLRYPDGPRDAETLMVDPHSGDLYVVSKELSGRSALFRAAAPHAPGKVRTLERVLDLTFGSGNLAAVKFTAATAGDIAPDGAGILLRTYLDVLYFSRKSGETVATAMARAPCAAPLRIDGLGEAVAFEAKGGGYYTLAEGAGPTLYYYKHSP